MKKEITIGENTIGKESVYIIAEMSANHNMDFERAKRIIEVAACAGANAIKVQTYTADTITIDCREECFMTQSKLWEGMTLYELYKQAYTPWEWQGELKEYANSMGLDFFSSPFDLSSVDFLENLDVPAYKIASYEINDIPLIKKVAKTGKPVIISTGIAYHEDIELALKTCYEQGNGDVILLKCVSAYPAPFEDVNLRMIAGIEEKYGCIVGLSDHTIGSETAVASVALGAKVIEKHLTISRDDGGVDSAFSLEPLEFAQMVSQIRNIEKALGKKEYTLTPKQIEQRQGSRSLFVVEDICEGEIFTEKNLRSIRPGVGLHTKYYEDILGKKAFCNIKRGTPMKLEYIEGDEFNGD